MKGFHSHHGSYLFFIVETYIFTEQSFRVTSAILFSTIMEV